ncbi:MAG: diguanylate cyclase [Desulfovibrionales bacterium]|nr:MAG: diguanylate cyclase [Desulfovibrionales bacterium]
MFIKTPDPPASQMRLERQDLITLEAELRQAMACFLNFSSYGLYFPSQPPQDMLVSDAAGQRIVPVFHAKEKKALLPLHRHGELLGIFVARNVSGKVTKNTLHLWSCLCDQIMDNLLLHKKNQVDPLTGLANAACLEENLAREIRLVHRGLWPDTPACLEEGVSEFSASVGLIFLDVDGFSRINERWGYQFGDHVLQQLGRMVARTAPEQAICARLREDTLAISFSGATAAKCHQLARTFAREAAAVYCENAINGERIQLSVSQGYVTYPQDFHGRQLRRSVREQTGVMLEKARRALREAQEQSSGGIQGFSGILRESGMILDVLPMNRILVSLGRSVDAREGQRFLVWAAQSGLPGGEPDGMETTGEHGPEERICKAEIQLVDVLGETSVAEVVLQHEPGCALMPQDQLTILAPGVRQDVPGRSSGAEPGPARRSASGLAQVPNIGEDEYRSAHESQIQALLQVSDFSRYWTPFRQSHSRFTVMLIYMETSSIAMGRPNHDDVEHMVRKLGKLAAQGLGADAVLGRFSFSTMACLIPDQGTTEVETAARSLVRTAGESLHCAVSIGLAEYPFLNFSKADVLDNCRKALEHALMLPAPAAVSFCSTSLTVSADRAFSSGDIYSAVEEYKVALLADESNLLARNSLGVCYARLAKYGDALAQFSEVLRRDPDDIMATYNQGHTLLKQGEGDLARQAFERCLELDPQHVFSLIRLGQLAEQHNDLDIARDRYHRALLVPGGEGVTHRHLARLEMAEGNLEQAREHLHQALVHNPKDALAMHLLASMYLEHGDDPEIAETLARQSVALRPEVDAYWNVLARVLERQGKTEEAAQAREQGDSPAC